MPKMVNLNKVMMVDESDVKDMQANGWKLLEQRPEPIPEPEKPTRGRKKAEQEEPVTEE